MLLIKSIEGEQEHLVSTMKAGLKPLNGSFFGRSLKPISIKVLNSAYKSNRKKAVAQFGA